MQHRSAVNVLRELTQHLTLERQHLGLLLLAVSGHALVVTPPELFRSQIVADVSVGGSKRPDPRRRSAARDDQQTLRRDAKRRREPAEERHPVQQLETDLAQPWADDDRVAAG